MSSFRTIEVSDHQFEKDNLRFVTVKTPHLKGRGDICLFVPPGIEKNNSCPLVILLHGVYGSSWSWAMQGGAHITAMKLILENQIPPFVIAMPSDGLWGDGSGYVPHGGFDFEKWIAIDVPNVVSSIVKSVSPESKMFIGGLSMGGFGALKIGVKYSKKFSAISAHSSLTNLAQMKKFVEERPENYFQPDKSEEDILKTILKNRGHLPPLRFDCGLSDLLLTENRSLHNQLIQNNILHHYFEYAGGHEWSYWQTHIKDSLLFFGGCYQNNI